MSLQSQTVKLLNFNDKIILDSTGKDSVIHGRNALVWLQALVYSSLIFFKVKRNKQEEMLSFK